MMGRTLVPVLGKTDRAASAGIDILVAFEADHLGRELNEASEFARRRALDHAPPAAPNVVGNPTGARRMTAVSRRTFGLGGAALGMRSHTSSEKPASSCLMESIVYPSDRRASSDHWRSRARSSSYVPRWLRSNRSTTKSPLIAKRA